MEIFKIHRERALTLQIKIKKWIPFEYADYVKLRFLGFVEGSMITYALCYYHFHHLCYCCYYFW